MFYGISNIVGYLMPNPFYTYNQFYFKQFSLPKVRSLDFKTDLFQTIQFSISAQFNSILLIDKTLSSATTPGQNGPGSDGITVASPSDLLVSYPGHTFGECYRDAVGVFYNPNRLV